MAYVKVCFQAFKKHLIDIAFTFELMFDLVNELFIEYDSLLEYRRQSVIPEVQRNSPVHCKVAAFVDVCHFENNLFHSV